MDEIEIINAKIQEIRKELISLYGENTTELKDGYKLIKINGYLNAFNKFVATLTNCFNVLGWHAEDYTNEILLLLDFAKNTEYNIVDYAAKSIKLKFNEARFSKLFNDLSVIYNKNLGFSKVGRSISSSFNIWLAGQETIYYSNQNRIRRPSNDQFN